MTSGTRGGGQTARWPDEYQDVAALFERKAALDEDDPERRILRDALVTRCLPLAEHIARRFDGRGEAHDDLVQVARLGLVNSVDRFDVTRGSDFVSFAVPTIMGEVRRHFRDTGWAVRVPRRMKELHLALSLAVGELSQTLGHAPTVSELAEHLHIDQEDVAQGLLAGNAYQTVSVDNTSSERSGELSMVETIGDYDAAMDEVENHETLRPLLESLPERERTVLMLRFFGNMTQTQIADRVGISQMHVSRLLAKTLASLRDQLGEA
ncbi:MULTISPECIES: SigB/SigF/SigG family RNA polymerase sigma factor [Rhodococcus]|uniref:SigB/SigF/SigG family RNA polymerase sigma factor n=1 Tax=Rhodococcus oxybenzonivorans TaxID=1990687 RepID=A0AAE5A7C7_9NOCA|nr:MULTISPECIES: SigB/SigF/SigG family RNA polymerase sigma factor [Rhodococcus]MDV7240522.1 SigB/SigF/SigG family RNA polymerase sigma factor [Rhodococcus oxybenzonivorans]MDV7266795.1 SigB/SigF/SigG family RNA polymerase sigma factor [Rhodococcus oxybenzonivorans]MDV7272795.1 SigB/SigF/SigG family RNA polymerase sigma factor [Rhodococcus oxybenzonivorans]MDV7333466.1 SigB/SigF/SigG family RNA polymerase sigma factor [Rhodococcus oxybenzonivorans]MDV7342633.1 SigB/SigF/SigG family RNA polymer